MDVGLETKPRGKLTRELLAHRAMVDMTRPVLVSPARKLGYKFLAAEAAWILSGDNRVDTIVPYSRAIASFSDDGKTFFGAYGPKIESQFSYIVKALAEDQDTRQAVMTIWRENPIKSKDIPCTVSVQFLIREGKLICIDNMRSSDLWLGHPYDVFNFSMLSLAVLLELRRAYNIKLQLGTLCLLAGSKHIYETNFEGVKTVLEENPEDYEKTSPVVSPEMFESKDDLVEYLWVLAQNGKAGQKATWS